MPNPTTDSMMYQTMHRQPADVARILDEGWAPALEAAGMLANARRIFVTGIGTSYHASLVGGWLLRAAGADARAVSSFDLALYPDDIPIRADDAVIVMAHTGVKRFSGEAMARAAAAGATIISVGSQTAEHPGSQLILRTIERETSAAYTSSHTGAMTVLAQIATELGERNGAAATAPFRDALAALPDHIAGVLQREGEIDPISEKAVASHVYAAGAGPNEATAIELVIKAREAAYGHVDGLAIEQFLHGPMVAFNAGDLAVFVNVPGNASERVGQIACRRFSNRWRRVACRSGCRRGALGNSVFAAGDPGADLANSGRRANANSRLSNGGAERHQSRHVPARRSRIQGCIWATQAVGLRYLS